jgi:hypothetical protein
MSSMIPQATIDAIRQMNDISLDSWGIECNLYIPNNINDIEPLDVYIRPSDYTYDEYLGVKCFIEWPPTSIYHLKALGMFTEGELPIVVCLPNVINSGTSEEQSIDILKGSYIVVPIQYIPSDFTKNSEFELVDIMIKGLHDAVLIKKWKAVPRRV